MKIRVLPGVLALLAAPAASAFCGFYVAQADASLFNQASQVVLVRHGDDTTMTMANDYRGSLSEFAVVIPVPVAVTREQVKVADKAMIDRLDAYSAPRLTEYFDPDPCPDPRDLMRVYKSEQRAMTVEDDEGMAAPSSRSLGVRVLDAYTVGEYDIVILSATQSSGLETWLTQNGYRIPANAGPILGSYIKQNMKFFVAKVNLREQAKTAQPYLRPLRISYSSPKFMLPIRLGMVNADGPQDLLVYALTERGRVETTNYRTTKLPTQESVPEFVKEDFGTFYKAMFAQQVKDEGMETVFTEYAWPLTLQCDPCSADPITGDELRALGVSWAAPDQYGYGQQPAYLTRLHLRYDLAHFPEDLTFQETADTGTWQAIYPIHHAFTGDTSCPAGRTYETELARRQQLEVQTLVSLTGWSRSWAQSRIPRRPGAVPPPPDNGGGGFWDWWK